MAAKYGPEYFAARRMSAGHEEHVPRTMAKLKRVTKLGQEMRVLEVGCGLGGLSRALAGEVSHVTAIDVSEHAIEEARAAATAKNIVFRCTDALSFRPAGKFDLALALSVFEHFGRGEQQRFLKTARRWLAPGGRLVLHVPIAESWSGRRRKSRRAADKGIEGMDFTGDPTHKATFSVKTFRKALTDGGFRIVKEWVRYSRWGWPAGWARVAMSALPARVRETFAMEVLAAAEPVVEK